MRISSAAMKKIISDSELKSLMLSGMLDEVAIRPEFTITGKTLALVEEAGHGIGLIENFRSIQGTPEEITERFLASEKEIEIYGDKFSRGMLHSYREMIEDRSDLSIEKKTSYRKLIIATWHNVKIVKDMKIPADVKVEKQH